MALVRCVECRKEVSDQAAVCPHCGIPNLLRKAPDKTPTGGQKKKKPWQERTGPSLLAVIVFVGIPAALIAWCASPSGTRSGESPPPPRLVDYKIVEQWEIPNGGFVKLVVIEPSAANESSLRALGDELKYDTRDDRNAFIFVFSDARAVAMRPEAIRDALSKKDARFYDRHFVASYSRNINTGFHQFSIMPKGLDGPQIDVTF
jgi:hypothetical protein